MGASHFVIADDDGKFAEPLAMTLDIIINTRDVAEGFPLAEYVSTLNVHGRCVINLSQRWDLVESDRR